MIFFARDRRRDGHGSPNESGCRPKPEFAAGLGAVAVCRCTASRPTAQKRLVKVASCMAGKPGESLPHQAETWADLIGAYRLFNNDAVEPAAIQQAHWQITRQ